MLSACATVSGGWVGGDSTSFAPSIPITNSITSWAGLAAVSTVLVGTGTYIVWVEASTLTLKVTQLLAGTEATDTANGLQRPNDYNRSTNARVWHQQRPTSPPVATNNAITSWATLAAITTVGLATGTSVGWVDTLSGVFIVTQLQAGTDATNTAEGLQRPNDYNGSTNAKVWYQAAT